MPLTLPEATGPAIRFAIQIVVGAIVFTVVLFAAFLLARLLAWMEKSGAPTWMITGAHWVEWLIFWLDVFLFGLFLLSEVLKFMVGLWKEWRD